jgi:hypothetical protein
MAENAPFCWGLCATVQNRKRIPTKLIIAYNAISLEAGIMSDMLTDAAPIIFLSMSQTFLFSFLT